MNPLTSIAPQTVTLEQLRVAARGVISPAVLESAHLTEWRDDIYGSLVTQLSVTLQAQRLADQTVTESKTVTLAAPASTWQMFKSRHASSWWCGWLVRRRPVRTSNIEKTVTLTARWEGFATFPDSSLVIRDARLGGPVYFSRVESWVDSR